MHPNIKRTPFFFAVIFLFFVQFSFASAMTTCPLRPDVTLNWTSSNCLGPWNVTSTNIACDFSVTSNGTGFRTIANGTTCTVSLACANLPTPVFNDTLTYDPSLVWDAGGGSCVVPANTIPTANITAPASQTINQGANLTFTGNGTDPDVGSSIIGYEWRDGGCAAGTLLSSAASFGNNTLTVGTHTIYFRVQDNALAWSTNCPSRVITVNGPAGLTGATTYSQVATGLTGNTVNTNIGATEAGVTFTWNNVPVGASVTVGPNATFSNLSYPGSGSVTYYPTVTLTDSGGAVSGPYTVTITLTAPANPTITTAIVTPNGTPTATIPSGTAFALNVQTAGATNLWWSRTTDPDGSGPLSATTDWPSTALGATTYAGPGTTPWAGTPTDVTYVWTFRAENSVGVFSANSTVTLTIAAAIPAISVTFPSGSYFGSIPVGSVSPDFPVRITNSGASGSVLTGNFVSSDSQFTCDTYAYSVTQGTPVNINCNFTPTLPFGLISRSLTFTNTNVPAVAGTVVGVSGTSISPITFPSAVPTTFIPAAPPVLNFGEVVITRYRELAFTMTNISQTAIPSFNLAFPVGSPFGCFAAGAAVVPCTVPSIAANGGTQTVTIRFTPPPPTQTTFTNTVDLNELAGPTLRTEFFTAIGTAVPPIFQIKEQ